MTITPKQRQPKRTARYREKVMNHEPTSAAFYRTASGTEPVRDWLLDLPDMDRRTIGYDISTAEFGWPIGMPICGQ